MKYPYEIRPKILDAFKELRKRGVVAKANFSCCSSCGHYEINDDYRNGKYRNKIGYCFWNRQAEEVFKRTARGLIGNLCIQYAGFDEHESLEIGKIVADTLREKGLLVIWDNDDSKAVEIDLKTMISGAY